jgi:citronellol/citronellal dehydrogenase
MPADHPLAGRTAIVTGASRGIGRAMALELARRGASVVVAARTVEPSPPWQTETIHETVALIEREGGRAIACAVDVRDEDQVAQLIELTARELGGIDLLVNNAAAFKMKPAVSTGVRDVRLVLDVNVVGAFACTMAALPYLRKSSCAHVVNVAPPIRAEAYWAAGKIMHAVSKVAVSVMTLGLAEELRPAKVSVCALWPKTVIASVGVERLGGPALLRMSRRPEITAEALATLVEARSLERTGRCWIDEAVLRDAGVEDFSRFEVDPDTPTLNNFFIDTVSGAREDAT